MTKAMMQPPESSVPTSKVTKSVCVLCGIVSLAQLAMPSSLHTFIALQQTLRLRLACIAWPHWRGAVVAKESVLKAIIASSTT